MFKKKQEGKEFVTRTSLEELVAGFTDGDAGTTGVSYLSLFLRHIILLGDILHTSRVKRFFTNLQQDPKTILTSLVFEQNECTPASPFPPPPSFNKPHVIILSADKKAASLAEQLGLNLARVLLDSLDPEGVAATRSNNQLDTESEDTQKREQGGNGGEEDGTKYLLNMDVVEYIGKKSVVLASLACMLRTPATRLEPDFFNYALSNTIVPIPHPILFPVLSLSLSLSLSFALLYDICFVISPIQRCTTG